jgi:nuclease S1
MNRRGLLLILLVVCSAVSRQAMAWGAQGHRVVATVAERRLEQSAPAELERAREYLRANNNDRDCKPCDDAKNLAAVANNPDDFRQIELALVTRDWHFVNIDIANPTYDQNRDCPNGDCVVRRIDRMVEILRDPSRSNCDRESALIYLIHFMGDMHQPFHTGFGRLPNGDPDLGGNRVRLNFDGRDTNLHSIWDSGIIEKQGRSDNQWVTRLMTDVLNGRDPATLTAGSTVDWLNQSHELARQLHTTNKPFNDQYVKDALPIIEERLLIAGLRLARLIEESVKASMK